MIGHHNWIEDMTVTEEIKAAKQAVQQVLKPNQVPGGSIEDNTGLNCYCQTPTELTLFPLIAITMIKVTMTTLTKIKKGKKVNSVEFDAIESHSPPVLVYTLN